MKFFRTKEHDTVKDNFKRCFLIFLFLNSITIYLSILFGFELASYIEGTLLKELTIALVQYVISFGFLGVIVIQLIIIYFFIRGMLIIKKQSKRDKGIKKGLKIVVHSLVTLLMMFSSIYFFIFTVASVLADTFVS